MQFIPNKRNLLQNSGSIRLSMASVCGELCIRIKKRDMNFSGKRKITLFLLLLSGLMYIRSGAETLTLDSCRSLAIANNKDLHIASMRKQAACYNRKSAFTAYLPKVSATGIYMHTGKELSLLSDEQKATLSGLGNALSMPALNHIGQGLTDALRTDTRNATGAAVILTQPLYMGGKIRAYNKIVGYAENIASEKYRLSYQNLVVEVEETYWDIVALNARKKLAASYRELVGTLDRDISEMISEGFATKADGLSVRVKVNEADVAVIQVNNGLEILKMKLCQLCGLPLNSEITLADEYSHYSDMEESEETFDYDRGKDRPELSVLSTAVKIGDEKVRLARAEFLPSVVLTGGYFASNPSVFNSFEKKFKGTWNIGVAVSIPILTWGDRNYKVSAAKAEAAAARFEFDETREKIELQISQNRQKVIEARQRYAASVSSQTAADENLRYATLGLREGVIPVSNVIEAQTAWLAARTSLISADIDLRMAYVYLKKSLGTIR